MRTHPQSDRSQLEATAGAPHAQEPNPPSCSPSSLIHRDAGDEKPTAPDLPHTTEAKNGGRGTSDNTARKSHRNTLKVPDFRRNYLELLGFEKFAPLLREDRIDELKLKKLMGERLDVQPQEKAVIWKILLGVYPVFREAWPFVDEQNNQHYLDLKRATNIIRYGELKDIEKSEKMSLDERARLIADIWVTQQSFSYRNTDDDLDVSDLTMIGRVFCSVCTDEADAYWCFSKFINPVYYDAIAVQIGRLGHLLAIIHPEINAYFSQHGVNIEDFSDRWFRTKFACCFYESTLLRLWDKLMTYSPSMFSEFDVLVALSLIFSFKNNIFKRETTNISHFLRNIKIPDGDTEQILSKTLEYQSILHTNELLKKPNILSPPNGRKPGSSTQTPTSSINSPNSTETRKLIISPNPTPPNSDPRRSVNTTNIASTQVYSSPGNSGNSRKLNLIINKTSTSETIQ